MQDVVLIRYGEIALKGRNRVNFENRLIDNIEIATGIRPKRTSGRFILDLKTKKANSKETIRKLKRGFGITSVSAAKEVGLDEDEIKKEALALAKKKQGTFRISVQRLQKRLKPSPELEREIGAYVVEKTGKKVKLKDADLEIFVEIAEKAYVFTEKIKCFGGLPLGIEGNVALLIDGKSRKQLEKSILAGLLMMKRGCNAIPFINKRQNLKLLADYGAKNPVMVKNIREMEKEALKRQCKAIVVSQTLGDFSELEADLAVLRPLIGYDEAEIKQKLKEYR